MTEYLKVGKVEDFLLANAFRNEPVFIQLPKKNGYNLYQVTGFERGCSPTLVVELVERVRVKEEEEA